MTPDGRHYLCATDVPNDPWAFLCGTDGPVNGTPPKLVDMSQWNVIGWSADGKTLRVSSRPSGLPLQVFLLDPATGVAQPWKQIGADIERAGFLAIPTVTFSADGESYAYTLNRSLMTLYVAEGVN
jgi:hypothetical protein